MTPVECAACGREFYISESCCGEVESGDLIVRYFFCPSCGWKHQIITTDPPMRELIERRKVLQRKIAIGHAKKFRESTLKKHIAEVEKIKAEQERLLPDLKERGEKILHGNPDAQ